MHHDHGRGPPGRETDWTPRELWQSFVSLLSDALVTQLVTQPFASRCRERLPSRRGHHPVPAPSSCRSRWTRSRSRAVVSSSPWPLSVTGELRRTPVIRASAASTVPVAQSRYNADLPSWIRAQASRSPLGSGPVGGWRRLSWRSQVAPMKAIAARNFWSRSQR